MEGSPLGRGQPGQGVTSAECRPPETLFRAYPLSGAATEVPEGGRLSRHKGPGGGWGCVLSGFGFLGPKPVKRGRTRISVKGRTGTNVI